MSPRTTTYLGIALAWLLVGPGCNGPIDDAEERVYFAPTERDELSSYEVPEPPEPSEEQMARVQPIIDGVERNAERLFARDDIDSRLPEIEQVYISSGRYLDLIGIYQRVVDAQGVSSEIAPRLVRHYLRLGQRHKAEELLDEIIVRRPDEATTWFLYGSYWLPEAEGSQQNAARVVASWEKTLELDPDYEGFERSDMPPLEEQLEMLEQRTTSEAIEEAKDEMEELTEREPEDDNPEAEADDTEDDKADDDKPTPTAEEDSEDDEKGEEVEEGDDDTRSLVEREPEGAQPHPPRDSEAAPSAPETTDEQESVRVTVTRGEMALSEGDGERAAALFEEALEREPDNADAQFGLIRAGWPDEARRGELRDDLEELAERDDLTPRQQYDIGRFAHSKAGADDLAADLWRQARERDPNLADTVDLDALIDRVR